MEIRTHESYVSLDVARLLKKAGFDWKVISYYRNGNDRIHFGEEPIDWNRQHSQLTIANDYSAPTLEVAQRWLREEKGMYIDVLTDFDYFGVFFVVKYIYNNKCVYVLDEDCEEYTHKIFKTYDEAQEVGIKKALEIILKEE